MKFLPAQYHCRMFLVQIPDGESPSQYSTPPYRVNIITNCQTVNSFINAPLLVIIVMYHQYCHHHHHRSPIFIIIIDHLFSSSSSLITCFQSQIDPSCQVHRAPPSSSQCQNSQKFTKVHQAPPSAFSSII